MIGASPAHCGLACAAGMPPQVPFECTCHGAKLTFDPQNRYTTLVWRFLPVAAEPDVRPVLLKLVGLERASAVRKYPPELFSCEMRTGEAGAALEGLCTLLFAPAVSSIGSHQAMY